MDTHNDDPDIIAVSKVFQRGKTVLPSEVRKLLNIKDGDKIVWRHDKVRYTPSGSVRRIIYIQVTGAP